MGTAMVDQFKNEWLANLQVEAEKQIAFNEAKQKVEGDAEYQKKKKVFDTQLELLKKKREEILDERQKFELESINKALEEMNSKYRMKI